MIPKIIHYCWFGNHEKPESVKKYISTWQKFCPDYRIIEWNEGNFDIKQNTYCYEAYSAKKWAFVTDYVRLKVLYDYGGIYMDTDVEVIKSLDDLLDYNAVSGYEVNNFIPTGTMAACKKNRWIRFLLQAYDELSFIKSDGSFDLTPNTVLITRLTKDHYCLDLNGNKTIFDDNIVLLPYDYLCAKSYETGEITKTDNTYTIHHFSGSWLPDEFLLQREACYKMWKWLFWLKHKKLKIKIYNFLITVFFEDWQSLFKKIKLNLFNYFNT